MQRCPCGKPKILIECCERFISGQQLPKTPEELMRSRYTAFTQADMGYIGDTMKPPAANDFDPESAKSWTEAVKWLRLEVIGSGEKEGEGWVEFIAHFEEEGETLAMHERSKFRLDNGKWFYVDEEKPKSGRNDPCHCGSDKKYKKCCGN